MFAAATFARRDGADDGGRTRDAVAAGKYAVHVVDLAAGLGNKGAALDGDLALLEAVCFHALSDGDYDPIRRDALFKELLPSPASEAHYHPSRR